MSINKPSQFKAHPIFGHIPQILAAKVGFYESLLKFGDIARFRYFHKEFYWINNPEYIKRIMVEPIFERSELVRKFMGSFLGAGVFTQEGDLHLQQRRLMMPAFKKNNLNTFADMMINYTHEMMAGWRDRQARNLSEDMMELTLRIVSRALFATDSDNYTQQIKAALHIIQDAIDVEYPYYTILPQWMPVMRFGKSRQAVQELQNITRRIIKDRRLSSENHEDLLTMLLLAEDDDGTMMTNEQVSGQVLSLLFAGHETTANGLSWVWYVLSKYPDVLAKVQEEVDRVIGTRRITIDDIPKMPYLRMVIDETFRMYPPAWYTERVANEDVTFGDYHIPAGTPLVITVYATHRDPRFFDNPLEFRPERFSPENRDTIQKFSYLPFGSGTHICIGNNFSMLEIQLVIPTMLQHLNFTIPDNYVPKPRAIVTMGIEGGLPVQVNMREKIPVV